MRTEEIEWLLHLRFLLLLLLLSKIFFLAIYWDFGCPVDESFTVFHRRILDIVTNVTEDYTWDTLHSVHYVWKIWSFSFMYASSKLFPIGIVIIDSIGLMVLVMWHVWKFWQCSIPIFILKIEGYKTEGAWNSLGWCGGIPIPECEDWREWLLQFRCSTNTSNCIFLSSNLAQSGSW